MESGKERKPRAGGVHAGHRSRLRKRFLNAGLDSFQDHEVLELLLCYAIPRRDVNETAHLLLDRFGTLMAVLDAPEAELQAVPGVGPATAHFLNLIPQLIAQMSRQCQRSAPVSLASVADVADFLPKRLRVPLTSGEVLLVLTDRASRVLAVHRYDSFQRLTIREIALRAATAEASACIIIEHVPDCTDLPLSGRLEALRVLSEKLAAQTTPLADFFTVDDLGHLPHSYARNGQLLPL